MGNNHRFSERTRQYEDDEFSIFINKNDNKKGKKKEGNDELFPMNRADRFSNGDDPFHVGVESIKKW